MIYVATLLTVYKGDSIGHFSEALDSVVKQKGQSGFVNRIYLHIDGKLDSKLSEYIDRNESAFYCVVRSEENIGLAKGLNKLIDKLEEEKYVFRMDADDVCDNTRYIQQIQYMENNPRVSILGGSISEFVGPRKVIYTKEYPCLHEEISASLRYCCPLAHVTVCFRSDVFEKMRYPVKYNLCEDLAFWNVLSDRYEFHNLKAVMVYVRMDEAFSRRTFRKGLTEALIYFKYAASKKSPIWVYLLVMARLIFRGLPASLTKVAYSSSIRTWVTK